MAAAENRLVPDEVIPHRNLPPLRYRDLPEPIPLRRMIGPSILLTGLALGSGEFILWPYITYRVGFVFFWACLLGVCTQYFLNTEIERWTLATGESAITGFCRLSWHWSWVFLVMNIVPWAWPGWATGAAEILSWLVWEPQVVGGKLVSQHVPWIAMAGLVLVGLTLTLGPVVYNTVEKLQLILVSFVFGLMIVLAVAIVRWPHVEAMLQGATVQIGTVPRNDPSLDTILLLGALAFAGAGGTTNLCQSNFIKDKGYGMGKYIGRITSPVTGQDEAVSDIGYHFPHTAENMRRWNAWWRAANYEHLLTFMVPCVVSLALLSLISYALIFGSGEGYDRADFRFIWGQAREIGARLGPVLRLAFLGVGVAVLLTTELGVLDACARISTDIVKVNYAREVRWLTDSRLYFLFLWGEIAFGCIILGSGLMTEPLLLLKTSAALNGGVMLLYSGTLFYLNRRAIPRDLAAHPIRQAVLVWSCAFFGYFTYLALQNVVSQIHQYLTG